MPLPRIDDVIRCSVRGVCQNGQAWVNVLHHRKSAGIAYAAAIAILDPKLYALYATTLSTGHSWRSLAPSTASLSDITYTPLDDSSASTIVGHVIAGSDPSAGEAPNAAAVISLRTSLRSRRNRGRVYWGPVGSDRIGTDGRLLATETAALVQQWDDYLASLVGSGVSLVVASYGVGTLHGVRQTWPAYATNVSSVTVDRRVDSQRRRLGRS